MGSRRHPSGLLRVTRYLGTAAAVVAGTIVAFAVAGRSLPNGLPLGVIVLGIVLGSLQALTALGLVLLYRSSRIINLAQAEIGGLAAATAVVLVVGKGLPYFVAMPLGLVVAGLTGLIIDATVVRRLFTAPRLIVTVATIGLAQVLGAAEIELPHLFTHLHPFTTFHAPFTVTVRVGPIVFGADDLMAVVVAGLALAGLWWFLVRSDVGVAIRAAADSQERAALLGIPVRRLSRITWVVAAVLSGAGAMLSAPILGANVGVTAGPVALLVPLAGMEHMPRAVLAAIGLSILQQAVFWSYPRSSVVDLGLFLFILAALLLQRRRAGREDETEMGAFVAIHQARPLTAALAAAPEVRWARWASIATLGLVAGALVLRLSGSQLIVTSYIAIYGIVAISLVLLTGWAGQISLGQFAFLAVGAAATGALYVNAGVDLFVALLAATLVGAIAAVLIGTPALRLPGLLLAVVTLAFAVPVSTWLINPENFPALTPQTIPRPELFGWLALSSPRTFAGVCLVCVAGVWALMANLRRSRTGRAIIAVRDNERAAASYGVDPTRTRLLAFGISGALCGFAGGLYAMALKGIGFAGFDPAESIVAFTMVVVGGIGSLGTALLGAAYVYGAQDLLTGAAQLLATGAGLLVLLMFVPGGLGAIAGGIRDRSLRWVAARHGIEFEAPAAGFDDRVPTGPAEPPMDTEDRVLRVSTVDAGYGPVQVLFGASIDVRRGEILALLGTNGAGKSTLLRVIAGVLPARAGRVELDGDDVRAEDASRRAAAGIALMPGGRAVFPSLTVEENLRLGGWLHRSHPQEAGAALAEVLDLFPILGERSSTRAGLLSGGQQQMLGLALAMLSRPQLLLIDELSLGLAPAVVSQLLEAVREINRRGVSVVIVEQSLNVAASIADRAVFLERGNIRFSGLTRELIERDDLARAVFLAPGAPTRPDRRPSGHHPVEPHAAEPRPPALAVDSLRIAFGGIVALDGVSLTVAPGGILGIIGSNGAGKTTLLDACSGFVPARDGTVSLGGRDVTGLTPAARAVRGLGRSFQGARLFPTLTVTETLALALERHLDVREPLASALALGAARRSEAEAHARVDELLDHFQLGRYRNAFISELSTGTRRIVELACAMAHAPGVLLLDEPSSGLAQRETESLGAVLDEVRRDLGAALVLVEHDIPLVCGVADELICLHLGTILAAGRPGDVIEDPAVISSYLGTDDAAIRRSSRRRRPAVAARRSP
jgi:ABC-type branched-subunit amino acid transport system ATPase component/ABC-type branched-subunit amino acid transport system permease subunit